MSRLNSLVNIDDVTLRRWSQTVGLQLTLSGWVSSQSKEDSNCLVYSVVSCSPVLGLIVQQLLLARGLRSSRFPHDGLVLAALNHNCSLYLYSTLV